MKPTAETKELDYAIALLTRSSERAKDVAEMLDEIKDAVESLELYKSDLEAAREDGDVNDIAEATLQVEERAKRLADLRTKLSDKVTIQMSILAEAVEAAQEATRSAL
jgi:DNA repair exonuclease SbcCD ATPase subunit